MNTSNILDPSLPPEEDARLVKLYRQYPHEFIESYLKIKPKKGDIQLLKLNVAQQILYNTIQELRAAGKRIRIIILKARQTGLSTFTEAMIFCRARLYPNSNCLIVAHEKSLAETIFKMSKLYFDGMPTNLKPMCRYMTKENIEFGNKRDSERASNPGLMSTIQIATAKNVEVGTGTTLHGLHCTETTRWANASETFLTLLQAVSDEDPEAFAVIESTARGSGDYFHKLWKQAVRGKNEWTPVFIPFWAFPEYEDVVTSEDEQKLMARLSPEEQEMLDGCEFVTPGKLAWRRRIIATKCENSTLKFNQEYPWNPEVAFSSQGETIIDLNAIEYFRDNTVRPGQKGELTQDSLGRVIFVPQHNGRLTIWEHPKKHEDYAAGADGSLGSRLYQQLAEYKKQDDMGQGDYSAVVVMSSHREQVAEFHDNLIDPGEFGDYLVKIGMYYQNCVGVGSLVRCERGMVPIEQVHAGDRVLTHRGRFCRVNATSSKWVDKVYGVKSVGLPELVVTSNHRLLVMDRSKYLWDAKLQRTDGRVRYFNPHWQSMDDGELEGKGLCSVAPIDVVDVEELEMPESEAPECRRRLAGKVKVDSRFCFLMGYYMADGTHNRDKVVFWGRGGETALHDFVAGYLQELGLNPQVVDMDGNSVRISVGCRNLVEFFNGFGKHTEKRFPEWVVTLPREKQIWVLIGYLSGDGHFGPRGIRAECVATTAIYQLYEMALRCGLYPSLWSDGAEARVKMMNYGKGPRESLVQPVMTLIISGYGVEVLKADFPEDLYRMNLGGRGDVAAQAPKKKYVDEYLVGRVSKVVEKVSSCAGEVEENSGVFQVYDLQVEGDQSFVVQGVAVHNCMLLPEVGNQAAGFAIIDRLKKAHYPRVGRWQRWDHAQAKNTHFLGFEQTCKTIPILMSEMMKEARRGAGLYEPEPGTPDFGLPRVQIRSESLLDELSTYALLSDGTLGSRYGTNDDLAVSWGLCLLALWQIARPTDIEPSPLEIMEGVARAEAQGNLQLFDLDSHHKGWMYQ